MTADEVSAQPFEPPSRRALRLFEYSGNTDLLSAVYIAQRNYAQLLFLSFLYGSYPLHNAQRFKVETSLPTRKCPTTKCASKSAFYVGEFCAVGQHVVNPLLLSRKTGLVFKHHANLIQSCTLRVGSWCSPCSAHRKLWQCAA